MAAYGFVTPKRRTRGGRRSPSSVGYGEFNGQSDTSDAPAAPLKDVKVEIPDSHSVGSPNKFYGLLDNDCGPQQMAYEVARMEQQVGQSKMSKDSKGMSKKARWAQMWKRFGKKSPEMVFPKTVIKRTVQEVLPDGYSISAAALDCLHQAAEVAIVQVFKDSLVMATHSSRSELYPADMRTVASLRGNDITFRGWCPQGPNCPRKRRRKVQ